MHETRRSCTQLSLIQTQTSRNRHVEAEHDSLIADEVTSQLLTVVEGLTRSKSSGGGSLSNGGGGYQEHVVVPVCPVAPHARRTHQLESVRDGSSRRAMFRCDGRILFDACLCNISQVKRKILAKVKPSPTAPTAVQLQKRADVAVVKATTTAATTKVVVEAVKVQKEAVKAAKAPVTAVVKRRVPSKVKAAAVLSIVAVAVAVLAPYALPMVVTAMEARGTKSCPAPASFRSGHSGHA